MLCKPSPLDLNRHWFCPGPPPSRQHQLRFTSRPLQSLFPLPARSTATPPGHTTAPLAARLLRAPATAALPLACWHAGSAGRQLLQHAKPIRRLETAELLCCGGCVEIPPLVRPIAGLESPCRCVLFGNWVSPRDLDVRGLAPSAPCLRRCDPPLLRRSLLNPPPPPQPKRRAAPPRVADLHRPHLFFPALAFAESAAVVPRCPGLRPRFICLMR